MSDIFVATETFAVDLDGADTMVHDGITRVRDGHPLLALRPQAFKRVEDGVHFDVEDTRGGPGSKRTGKRGLKAGDDADAPTDPKGK